MEQKKSEFEKKNQKKNQREYNKHSNENESIKNFNNNTIEESTETVVEDSSREIQNKEIENLKNLCNELKEKLKKQAELMTEIIYTSAAKEKRLMHAMENTKIEATVSFAKILAEQREDQKDICEQLQKNQDFFAENLIKNLERNIKNECKDNTTISDINKYIFDNIKNIFPTILEEILKPLNMNFTSFSQKLLMAKIIPLGVKKGDVFDPKIHQIIELKNTEEKYSTDTVVEVIRDGYKFEDKNLTCALVFVAKKNVHDSQD